MRRRNSRLWNAVALSGLGVFATARSALAQTFEPTLSYAEAMPGPTPELCQPGGTGSVRWSKCGGAFHIIDALRLRLKETRPIGCIMLIEPFFWSSGLVAERTRLASPPGFKSQTVTCPH